jgi:colicin import membrane protein
MCTKLKAVYRDGCSTCSICGGQDAYGESPERPPDKKKTVEKAALALAKVVASQEAALAVAEAKAARAKERADLKAKAVAEAKAARAKERADLEAKALAWEAAAKRWEAALAVAEAKADLEAKALAAAKAWEAAAKRGEADLADLEAKAEAWAEAARAWAAAKKKWPTWSGADLAEADAAKGEELVAAKGDISRMTGALSATEAAMAMRSQVDHVCSDSNCGAVLLSRESPRGHRTNVLRMDLNDMFVAAYGFLQLLGGSANSPEITEPLRLAIDQMRDTYNAVRKRQVEERGGTKLRR